MIVLTSQRKAMILDRLRNEGTVVARSLAEEWEVSEDTLRRDLRELASEGRLQRVHGGALPVSAAAGDFDARRSVATAEKLRVAKAAAAMVTAGHTVFIDGGTTAQALCRALPDSLRATVITHSPTIAVELMSKPTLSVLMIGGSVYRHSVVATGAIASEQIAGISADVFFMGVSGVHVTAGLTTGSAEEAATKRAISRRCAETYVLASSEKIGAASPFRVVGFGEVAGAITDSSDARAVRSLRRAGLNVVVAK
jgi:DeoR/GlpR family transcriptional regulator of sugar metabolism